MRDALRRLRHPFRSRHSGSTTPVDPQGPLPPQQSAEPLLQLQKQAASPPPAITPKEIRGVIWNAAYDKVREDQPKVVEAYEKILSVQLDAETRQSQMEGLVDKGLERTEKEARAKETIKDGMQLVKNVKDIADRTVKAEPTAVVAWVGITACMEIVTNPVSEPGINRDGIKYVLERVEWYWKLAELLLGTDNADKTILDLQSLLRKHIIKLFKKLLLYEMQSVCLYNRHWAAVIVRDLFKTDDWQESIDSIKKAEDSIRRDINQQNHEVFKFRLAGIDNSLQHLRQDVKDVELAVKVQTRNLSKIHHDEKDNECLKQLHVANPTTHKQKIENKKGGLLKNSYRWILDNDVFTGFLDDPGNRLLWIKGDPGKGKTMLLCGIIDELEKESLRPVFYFFCEATQDHLRTTTSVLRGLLWLLCRQYSDAMSCVRATYDIEGQRSLEDSFTLKTMFEKILQKSCLQGAIFVVDALDECSDEVKENLVDREELIEFIIEFSVSFPAKWIISSRNWPVIETQLQPAHKANVSLELNKDSVSEAVKIFIQHKADELARKKEFDDLTKNAVLEKLLLNADDTFLWVALACKELARPVVKNWEAVDIVDSLGSGLHGIYTRMLGQILTSKWCPICQQILAISSVVYRSLSIDELWALMPEAKQYNYEQLKDIVKECGSFLTIQDNLIYFVHQSARDFLIKEAGSRIFPFGIAKQHRSVFRQSLEALKVLRRDPYGLEAPGVVVDEISRPDPDPLSGLEYACIYWIDHLGQCSKIRDMSDDEAVHSFMTIKFLYWLEALSLQRMVAEVAQRIETLDTILLNTKVDGLADLAQDARRFLLSHQQMIKDAPLQVYVSALIFSPTDSLIRKLFEHEEPNWILLKPTVETHWDSCIQTVNIPAATTFPVALSSSGRLAAITSESSAINIWDFGWDRYVRSIETQSRIACMEFSPDDGQIAVGFHDGRVGVWHTGSGSLIHTFIGHEDYIPQVKFSPDGRLLASGSRDCTARLWDLSLNHGVQTFSGHGYEITYLSFSTDGLYLAVFSGVSKITVWNTANGECKEALSSNFYGLRSVVFLPDGSVASAAMGGSTIDIWDLVAGGCVKIPHNQREIESIVSLGEGRSLASSSFDGTIKIWDSAGACVQTLYHGHRDILSLAYCPSRQVLAEILRDRSFRAQGVIFKAWDLSNITAAEHSDTHGELVDGLVFSDNGQYLASRPLDRTFILWDSFTGTHIDTLEHHDDNEYNSYGLKREIYRSSQGISIVFSPDSRHLLSFRNGEDTMIWNTANGNYINTFSGVTGRAFSPNGQWLALAFHRSSRVKIWDTSTRSFLTQEISSNAFNLVFSGDGNHLALSSQGNVEFWDISTTPFTCKKEIQPDSRVLDLSPASKAGKERLGASQEPTYCGHGLSEDGSWLVEGRKRKINF
ncbi:hypothetical protein FDECE_300 [Fusarium decemcellulare]|nr:hypothetical protein FDECE_300 [Fusarium decemcellulare]